MESGVKLKNNEEYGSFEWLKKKQIEKLPKLLPELKHILPYILSSHKKTVSYCAYYESGTVMTNFHLEE